MAARATDIKEKPNRNQEAERWFLSCVSFEGKKKNSCPEVPMDSINPSAGGAQPSVRSESRLESGVQRRWVLPALRSLRQEEEVRFEASMGYIVRPCCPLSPHSERKT